MNTITLIDLETIKQKDDAPLRMFLQSFKETQSMYMCHFVSSSEEMIDFARSVGIKGSFIKTFSLFNPNFLYTISKTFKKKNNLIHAFNTFTTEKILPLHSLFSKNTKFLSSSTTIPVSPISPKKQKLYANIHHVTCPTKPFANTFSHILHYPLSNITVVPFGIMKELYTKKVKNSGRTIIAVVAPLEVESNLFEILDTLVVLHKANILRNWEVRFIGVGSLFNALLEYARKLEIIDYIALLGDMPLDSALQEGSIMILPKFYWDTSQAIYAAIQYKISILHAEDFNFADLFGYQTEHSTTEFVPNNPLSLRTAIKNLLENPLYAQIPVLSLDDTIKVYHKIYTMLLTQ
ncbi:MAG: hypothetical protein ACRCV3_01470 [Desulfovibrionaceae bacterium]